MVKVQHTRHTIKPEAIKLIFVHPKAEVTQKEAHNLVMAVVEQPAVPLVMASLASRVEVLMVCTIKLVQAVQNILGGVAVNNVEEDDYAQAVSGIDKLLEIFWGTISAARSEEVVNLVAKAGVVSVLHDGHELDDIVAEILDTRQHVLGELLVSRNTLLGCGDADMGLVHASTCGLLGSRMLELIPFRRRWVPEVCIVGGRD
jgi:hypothetical protein